MPIDPRARRGSFGPVGGAGTLAARTAPRRSPGSNDGRRRDAFALVGTRSRITVHIRFESHWTNAMGDNFVAQNRSPSPSSPPRAAVRRADSRTSRLGRTYHLTPRDKEPARSCPFVRVPRPHRIGVTRVKTATAAHFKSEHSRAETAQRLADGTRRPGAPLESLSAFRRVTHGRAVRARQFNFRSSASSSSRRDTRGKVAATAASRRRRKDARREKRRRRSARKKTRRTEVGVREGRP